MKNEKDVKIITALFSLSVLLVMAAFLTITSTFAYPRVNKELNWSVKYVNTQVGNTQEGRVNVGVNSIDFSARLDKFGEEFGFTTEIKNDGDFDAVLSKITKTDLSTYKVGTSAKTGETYYLDDYIYFDIKYAGTTEKNGVYRDTKVKAGDKLYHNTSNKIKVTLKYRDKSKLSTDQLEVLSKYGYVIELDLSIDTLYLEM